MIAFNVDYFLNNFVSRSVYKMVKKKKKAMSPRCHS